MGAPTPPRRFAGLDGLRALAVLAVLAYHAEPELLPGGFLGVDLFFVVSGFLITTLLLPVATARPGHARAARAALARFWERRIRRLLPALLVVLGATVAAAVVLAPEELPRLRRDAPAAVLGLTNWELLAGGESYFEAAARPSLLRHLWSLAVEAQFYLAWPIVLLLTLRVGRAAALLAAGAGAVASAVAMAMLLDPGGDPSRAYFGTDTHASGLLIGAALAIILAWAGGRRASSIPAGVRRVAGIGAAMAGGVALLVLAGMIATADTYDPALYQGGFVAFDLAAAVLIAALTVARPLARALDAAPLQWIGERSYGIYLWHWPIYQLTRPGIDVPLEPPAAHALRLGLTIALAAVSYRLVEQPVRRMGWRPWRMPVPGRRAALRAATPLAVVAASAVALGTVLPASAVVPLPSAGAPALPPAVLDSASAWIDPPRDAGARPDVPPHPPDDPADDIRPAVNPGRTAAAGQPPGSATPDSPPPSPAATAAARPWAAPASRPRVFAVGDSVMLSALDQMRRRIGGLRVDAKIGRFFPDAPAIVDRQRDAGGLGDIVIIHLGNNGPFYRRHFDAVMARLADVPLVVFVNLKLPRDWEAHNNKLLSQAVRHHPNAILVDWHTVAAEHPEVFWKDGYHVRANGGRLYAQLITEAIASAPTRDLASSGSAAP